MIRFIKQLVCNHKYEYENKNGYDHRDFHYILICRKCDKTIERFL